MKYRSLSRTRFHPYFTTMGCDEILNLSQSLCIGYLALCNGLVFMIYFDHPAEEVDLFLFLSQNSLYTRAPVHRSAFQSAGKPGHRVDSAVWSVLIIYRRLD